MMSTIQEQLSAQMNKLPTWLMALIPLLLLAGLVVFFLNTNPIQVTTANLPPIEELNIDRIDVTADGFSVQVTNGGPDTIEIAQVLVDEAYWNHQITPDPTLERLETATINIAYPWVTAEPNEIVIITSTGVTFAGEVELAVKTPTFDFQQALAYGLVGVYVGVIPVGLGLLWFPVMRKLDRRQMGFVLSLTIGLLIFLLVDTLLEAFEVAEALPGVFQGVSLALFAALITWLAITAIGNHQAVADKNTRRGRMFVAFIIAVGIGFHNLGEGLAVGSAFALGEAALGSFLVVGFILHNVTEGIGIAAPVTGDSPSLKWFLAMLLVAGAPAIAGTLIGGFAFSPLLAVIFLGIGVGAIWQVVVEVGRLLHRDAERDDVPLVNWVNVAGLLAGIGIMYGTAFLVN